ncbi:hypothetical protein COL922a_011378 [Colletotrichum nupharicola]|nr:hypothetical protein COL922a_011378 [Colletotrichum nupharicola]
MEIAIQSAKSEDIPAIVEFIKQARSVMFPWIDAESQNEHAQRELENFSKTYLDNPNGAFLTAYGNGQIIAAIGYAPYDDRFPELGLGREGVVEFVRLYVDPTWRRAGLASKLCAALEQRARDAGMTNLYLHTHPFLEGAIGFWERQGQAQIRELSSHSFSSLPTNSSSFPSLFKLRGPNRPPGKLLSCSMNTLSDDMQRSGAAYLPPELWEMIIGSITDCDYLPRVWFNFRRVSRTFKEITERVFSSNHLRYSRVTHVCLDFFIMTPKGGFIRVDEKRLMLDFDRRSDDGERAVFNEKHFTSFGHLDKQIMFNRRRYKIGDILDGFRGGWAASHNRATREDRPPYSPSHEWADISPLPHIFSLRRIANDTDLPGAEYDFEGL